MTTSMLDTVILKELVETIVKAIVDYPKSVEVMEVEGERITLIEQRVAKDSMEVPMHEGTCMRRPLVWGLGESDSRMRACLMARNWAQVLRVVRDGGRGT